MSERVWIHTDGQCFGTFTEDPKGYCSACSREGMSWALRWPRSPSGASPTGRQLGPGKRDELPPIVSEGMGRDARIRELEGALEPFAKAGERFDRSAFHKPAGGPYSPMPDSECVAGITIGSLRRARSALSKATGEGG